jgi:hypothetical protein
MLMLKLLVLLALLFLAIPAPVAALTITQGGLGFTPNAGSGQFGGEDFFVAFSDGIGLPGLLSQNLAGIQSLSLGVLLPNAPPGFGDAFVRVGDLTCQIACGSIALTLPQGLPPAPPDHVPGTPIILMAPFTATGHLNLGPGFDLVGQGTASWFFCVSPCDNTVPTAVLSFRFMSPATVPEPSLFLLLALGIAVVIAYPGARLVSPPASALAEKQNLSPGTAPSAVPPAPNAAQRSQ